MCADAAIHDTDGHNPHAHIMLTVRPLDERGGWQYKTEKEYLCVKDGEERGFTAAEFKAAQTEGWEKQYQYKVGRKKEYMAPSVAEAKGYERASKHPKKHQVWQAESPSPRHRSNADRGLDEQPAIHEGVTARALEKKGIVSDRCEINRQIRADNALLRS